LTAPGFKTISAEGYKFFMSSHLKTEMITPPKQSCFSVGTYVVAMMLAAAVVVGVVVVVVVVVVCL